MRRRDLIVGLASTVTWTSLGSAQQSGRSRRIGVSMSTAEQEPHEQAAIKALVGALAVVGWEAGRNLDIIYRGGPALRRSWPPMHMSWLTLHRTRSSREAARCRRCATPPR